MENPWLNPGASEGSFVLDIDRNAIVRYNDSISDPGAKVIVEFIPEPFIGDPVSARVVLLGLSPHHSEKDEEDSRCVELQNAKLQNLCHEPQEYPFYPLNPSFEGTGAAAWWRPLTLKLQEETGLDTPTFAKRLLVIEWFPYHSRRSVRSTKPICESQKYSFQLAKRMLERKGVIGVGMRSRNHWVTADRWFGQVPFLKSCRCPWITKGNMDQDLFGRITNALKGDN